MKQQVGELIGTAVSAFTIGGVLLLLDKAWGFGTVELAAPQATLMKMIVEGVMEGNLPWMLIFIGVFIAVAVEIMGIPGLPVAEVAAAKGYGCKIAVQPGTSEERVKLVQAYGAETFEPYIGKDVMESLADVDRVAAETPGGWVPTQFHNLNNGGAHYATTGPEIYRDTDGKVDIYVAGVGTGGTASGTSEFLKKVKPEIYTVAVQPSPESVATPEKSVEEMTGIHKFTEIDPSFVPGNVHIDAFDEIYDVQTEEALSALQELARTEGVLMGYSGGAALYAAIKLARRPENKDKLIVFIVPDNGERYLSQDIYSKRSSQDRVVL